MRLHKQMSDCGDHVPTKMVVKFKCFHGSKKVDDSFFRGIVLIAKMFQILLFIILKPFT